MPGSPCGNMICLFVWQDNTRFPPKLLFSLYFWTISCCTPPLSSYKKTFSSEVKSPPLFQPTSWRRSHSFPSWLLISRAWRLEMFKSEVSFEVSGLCISDATAWQLIAQVWRAVADKPINITKLLSRNCSSALRQQHYLLENATFTFHAALDLHLKTSLFKLIKMCNQTWIFNTYLINPLWLLSIWLLIMVTKLSWNRILTIFFVGWP